MTEYVPQHFLQGIERLRQDLGPERSKSLDLLPASLVRSLAESTEGVPGFWSTSTEIDVVCRLVADYARSEYERGQAER